jgi:hypothetical protein
MGQGQVETVARAVAIHAGEQNLTGTVGHHLFLPTRPRPARSACGRRG